MATRKSQQLTKAQLNKAAKLRAEGKSWTAIRDTLGTNWQSSSFFRAWEREGIEHRPATPQPQRLATLAKRREGEPTAA